ncbi:helix-turn-helix domain-containing protein [Bailinhaonella thermotolerans]|uniref:helix-turn-helix domain-containing protein n=1 Tax=Bailinhaonella thermotolerans TaxID=1070861 RepID=UPI00192A1FB8|nr:helix-turn-helix transcriptional regulator [Bailinhaonella thermotolerans]
MRSEPIGRLIALRRQELGHSQARLAELLNEIAALDPPTLTRHEISRWERGDRLPRTWLPALATALRLPVEELREAAELARVRRANLAGEPGVLTGWTDGDADERVARTAGAGRRVDAAVAESLGVVLAGQRRTEDLVGAGAVVGAVRGQLRAVEALVTEARGPARTPMVDMAAQWAQFAGWLHTSLGDWAGARGWFDRAAEWALEADNPTMTATVLSFRAHIAWSRGEIGPLIGLAAAARRQPGVYPGLRAYDALQEARGHAMTGDAAETERRLEESARQAALAAEASEPAPPWMYYHTPDFWLMQRGIAYRYLARTHPEYLDPAITLLTGGLEALGPARQAEWAAEYLLHLALAHHDAAAPARSSALALEALSLLHGPGSLRLTRALRALHARLHRHWPAHPDVTTLGEALATTAPSPADTPA